MLVRILEGSGSTIKLPDMREGVVPLEPVRFTFNERGRSVTLVQFPVTLGYAITDYKCQGSTYKGPLVLEPKRTTGGPCFYDSIFLIFRFHRFPTRVRHRNIFNIDMASLLNFFNFLQYRL